MVSTLDSEYRILSSSLALGYLLLVGTLEELKVHSGNIESKI